MVVLFFWLMWNDFSILLIEQLTSLTGILFKDHGASNVQIAFFGSLSGLVSMWLNPWFSTWSDRLRTPYGRRRPFLLVATPLFALSLMTIPFMPDFYHGIARHGCVAAVMAHVPIDGAVLFIGIACFVSGFFNAIVLALFSYLYWDVV
ncbi:MAG TPA: MFS transporter, partial [Candidatus Methylacidiphilales bacterium]